MAQAARAHEPTMEEILASIRRIIADDDAGTPPPSVPRSPFAAAWPEVPGPTAPAASDASRDAAISPADATSARPPPSQDASGPHAGEALLSDAAAAAVQSAFAHLGRTVQARNTRTLEDVVADVLRPMLKAWLDENLPAVVEQLVRAEVERISRGRGQS